MNICSSYPITEVTVPNDIPQMCLRPEPSVPENHTQLNLVLIKLIVVEFQVFKTIPNSIACAAFLVNLHAPKVGQLPRPVQESTINGEVHVSGSDGLSVDMA